MNFTNNVTVSKTNRSLFIKTENCGSFYLTHDLLREYFEKLYVIIPYPVNVPFPGV
jgi:hypothetical protein